MSNTLIKYSNNIISIISKKLSTMPKALLTLECPRSKLHQLCYAGMSIPIIILIYTFILENSLSFHIDGVPHDARERLSLLGLNLAPRDCIQIFKSRTLSTFFKSNEFTNILLDQRSREIVEEWIQKNDGERQVNTVFEELLFPQCSKNVLFLDIGANVGYYGIKATKFGCKSYLFDPQPGCIEIIENNLCLNFRHDDTIASVPFGLAKEAKDIVVPSTGCSGTFSLVHGLYEKPKEDFRTRLLDLGILRNVPNSSLIVKIDTEGNELDLLKGMLDLVREGKIRDIIVEVTPLFWDSMDISRHSAVNLLTQYLQYCLIYEPKQYKTSSFVSLTGSMLESLLTDPQMGQTDLWISCIG